MDRRANRGTVRQRGALDGLGMRTAWGRGDSGLGKARLGVRAEVRRYGAAGATRARRRGMARRRPA
jgi:hypothetical protein